ncbi:hypothetical protein BV898_06000 [Hypsibius exemplaris]|uniref:Uncharacterized protein n=1 Tax=Hypsibius exemplaris TaxID=2072580 RepID=A0A1W0WXT7_HYPEX|nr:hypothetical protein BV898_06000 [Hypsibius exemplaris]
MVTEASAFLCFARQTSRIINYFKEFDLSRLNYHDMEGDNLLRVARCVVGCTTGEGQAAFPTPPFQFPDDFSSRERGRKSTLPRTGAVIWACPGDQRGDYMYIADTTVNEDLFKACAAVLLDAFPSKKLPLPRMSNQPYVLSLILLLARNSPRNRNSDDVDGTETAARPSEIQVTASLSRSSLKQNLQL